MLLAESTRLLSLQYITSAKFRFPFILLLFIHSNDCITDIFPVCDKENPGIPFILLCLTIYNHYDIRFAYYIVNNNTSLMN